MCGNACIRACIKMDLTVSLPRWRAENNSLSPVYPKRIKTAACWCDDGHSKCARTSASTSSHSPVMDLGIGGAQDQNENDYR